MSWLLNLGMLGATEDPSMATTTSPLTGTFTATGDSDWVPVQGDAGISLSGGATATVVLEKSYDLGVTAVTVSKDLTPTDAEFTGDIELIVFEPEPYVLYRWSCTAYTSGTVTYRIGNSQHPSIPQKRKSIS